MDATAVYVHAAAKEDADTTEDEAPIADAVDIAEEEAAIAGEEG